MSKLTHLFRAMHEKATNFQNFEDYTDRTGTQHLTRAMKRDAVLGDLLALLEDGRDALVEAEETEAEGALRIDAFAKENGRLQERIDVLRRLADENNELRSLLHDAELNYAKLRGYLERMVDEQPPVMVPERREPMHASMPDGSVGLDGRGYEYPSAGEERPRQRWFQR